MRRSIVLRVPTVQDAGRQVLDHRSNIAGSGARSLSLVRIVVEVEQLRPGGPSNS